MKIGIDTVDLEEFEKKMISGGESFTRNAAVHMKFTDIFPKKIGAVTIRIGERLNYSQVKDSIEISKLIEEEFSKI